MFALGDRITGQCPHKTSLMWEISPLYNIFVHNEALYINWGDEE